MAKKKATTTSSSETTDLLKDLIIIQLGLAHVGQREIRAIVGADIRRVNRIVKLLNKNSSKPRKQKE